MDDGAPFLSLYVLSVSVRQAGVTCTSFLLKKACIIHTYIIAGWV